jgi:predicted Zn-dependent peptidase
MRLETNSALDNMIGSYQCMTSWNDATTYIDQVQKVNIDELNAVFKKYVKAIHWIYLGDVSKVDDQIFLQKIVD